ncbi:hypothetical protein [Treponema zioleckii]|uniref:hypothetical protein n=1 Tax=Treponema zioleckii TaxID=331680 RepID=UPI00168A80DD|nr:hypothetical protein [Treponema zioleckii]
MRKLFFLVQMLFASFLYAEKQYISEGFGIWSTADLKKFTPVMRCTNPILGEGSILTTQTVDEFNHFIFYRKTGTHYEFDEYQFALNNFKDSKRTEIYSINRKSINRELRAAFYSENGIFCLELSIDSEADFYITKRTLESPKVISEYKLENFLIQNRYMNIWSMYVDEKNERALFITAGNNGWPESMKIVSLRSGKEIFSKETNFRELFVEDGNVYLSVQNKLFTANYIEENVSLNEVKTFVPKKEKIIAMRKNYDIYVLRSEYNRFNPIHRFLFGGDSQIWTYYVCKIQNGKLAKVKKLKKP